MITVNNVSYLIGSRRILDNISVKVPEGTVTVLVGESGCGKTTLLNLMGLLLSPSQGSISVEGRDTRRWGSGQKRVFWAEEAAFIYQDAGIVDAESVGFNVTLRKNWLGRTKGGPAADEALAAVGLAGRASETASVLSGGEKQRLGIARALYKKARWIFADEPTASLDQRNKDTVLEQFVRLRNSGVGIVIATHDRDVLAIADQRVELGSHEVPPNRLSTSTVSSHPVGNNRLT